MKGECSHYNADLASDRIMYLFLDTSVLIFVAVIAIRTS